MRIYLLSLCCAAFLTSPALAQVNSLEVALSAGIGEHREVLGSIMGGITTDLIVEDFGVFGGFSLAHFGNDIRVDEYIWSNAWRFSMESFFGWRYFYLGVGMGYLWYDESVIAFDGFEEELGPSIIPVVSFGGILRYKYAGMKILVETFTGWSGELMFAIPVF